VVNENPATGTSGNEPAVVEGNEPVVTPQPGTKQVGESWVPEDLRSHKSLTKFKTPGDVAKAYVNLEGMLGNRIAIPGENATAEEKSAFRTKLGVPDKAEAYPDPDKIEGMPDLDEKLVGNFKQAAHSAGLGPAQAKFLMNWWIGLEHARNTENVALVERAKNEGTAKLRASWGAATGENIGLVQRLIAETGDEDLKEALERTGAGNDPAVLKWLAKLSRSFVEADLIDPKMVGTSTDEAKAEIEKVKVASATDKKHPYRNENHPGHKAEVERVRALYEIAYPDVAFDVTV